MSIHILKHRDFISGTFFALTGLATAMGSTAYALGTPMRMGPGYFPLLLGVVLIALGLAIALGSIDLTAEPDPAKHVERPSLRALILIAAGMLLFAFALHGAGLALATIGLVVLSGVAYREFRWHELGALGGVLSVFAVVVFVYGLGLPFQVLPA